jgi:GGDEF domain-containing protein
VLLPATSQDGAARVVARLRAAHPMTWSAGVAAWAREATLDTALAAADARLYAVKRARGERPGPAVAPVPASSPRPEPLSP